MKPINNTRYIRIFIAIAGALWLIGCTGNTPAIEPTSAPLSYQNQLRGAVFDPPRTLADYSIASTIGEPFTFSEHRGEIILLYFGYRTCPDYCPTTFLELRQIYNELGEPADRVKVIFVTVDPERDDIDLLTRYAQAFHEDFIGLRPEGEELNRFMAEFGAVAERQYFPDSAIGYLIDHTVSLFLIAPDGRLQTQYLYGTDYQDILHDVQLILNATS